MQKIIIMNGKVLIRVVLKPALQKKFQFKKINSCKFIVNKIEDTLELSAKGFIENDLNEIVRTSPPLKASDNNMYVSLFESEVKQQIKYKSISAIYFNIDFINNESISDVFYINENDLKQSVKIKMKL